MNRHDHCPPAPILLVDDEEQALTSYALTLRYNGFANTLCCSDSRQVPEILATTPVSVLVLDLCMPHLTGEELLEQVSTTHPDLPVVVVTGFHEVERVVRCMRAGSLDYLTKPVEPYRLLAAVTSAVELWRSRQVCRPGPEGTASLAPPLCGMLTGDPGLLAVLRYARAVARSPEPVLVTGETGAGKELAARALHEVSGLPGRFVGVNVAGLDDQVFADTLFGHLRGAFTGADRPRSGLVEQAASGTLFLDEIGDLGLASQLKLLRLLQEREYYPLGSDAPKASAARVVVATNLSLAALLDQSRFRRDLFYRLRTHHIHLPPLRERVGDLGLLLDHFLGKAAERLGRTVLARPAGLAELLEDYAFPGNVRELEAMVFDAVARHEAGRLSLEPFRQWIAQMTPPSPGAGGEVRVRAAAGQAEAQSPQAATLKAAQEAAIDEALARSGGNQSAAARTLGISRQALAKRLAARRASAKDES